MTNKVLIIGAGAIGGFYGSLLAKAGTDVVVVCRSEYEHVKQHAFPDNEIMSGLAYICCNRIRKGEILHQAYGRLTLGNLPCHTAVQNQYAAGL